LFAVRPELVEGKATFEAVNYVFQEKSILFPCTPDAFLIHATPLHAPTHKKTPRKPNYFWHAGVFIPEGEVPPY
jgi:hypothetical protein